MPYAFVELPMIPDSAVLGELQFREPLHLTIFMPSVLTHAPAWSQSTYSSGQTTITPLAVAIDVGWPWRAWFVPLSVSATGADQLLPSVAQLSPPSDVAM